jgi:hypothetical protein
MKYFSFTIFSLSNKTIFLKFSAFLKIIYFVSNPLSCRGLILILILSYHVFEILKLKNHQFWFSEQKCKIKEQSSCSCKTQRSAWARFHERSVKEPWDSVLVVWCRVWYPLKCSKLVLWEHLVFNVKIEGSGSSFCDQDPSSHLFLGTNTRTRHRN